MTRLDHSPRARIHEVAKRGMDVALVLLSAPVVLPLIGLLVVLIRVDSPGPAMFAQERTGRDGVRFRMYKFRTMVRDAEQQKAQLAHLNVLQPPDFKIPDDPRITRVGRVLRRTSLDELPQLWNVLRGDMSLVGPRPTSFAATTYHPWHYQRLEVLPGLTGSWQVHGRGELEFDDRLRLDIAYLRHPSILRDLQILLATSLAVLRRTGA